MKSAEPHRTESAAALLAHRSPLAALLAVLAVAGSGCTTDTTATTSTTGGVTQVVAADATMGIASPLDGACFPLPPGPDPLLPLTLTFQKADLTTASVNLRPSTFCLSLPGYVCGHIVVKVNGVFNNESATPTVNVLLRKLADPYQDLAIDVTLVADDGSTLLVAQPGTSAVTGLDAGVPLERSLTVKVRPTCGSATSSSSSSGATSSGSGAGGAGGSASDGG